MRADCSSLGIVVAVIVLSQVMLAGPAIARANGPLAAVRAATVQAQRRTAPSPQGAGDARGVLDAVNAERRRRGLGALSLDPRLTDAAAWQARDLARRGRLDHRGSDGSTVGERVSRTGYRWSTVEENLALAASATAPRTVVQMWMNSPGHRRNMLSREVTQVGVAHVRRIWVLVLARPGGTDRHR